MIPEKNCQNSKGIHLELTKVAAPHSPIKQNRKSIDNPLGQTCQSIFQRVPWFTLEIEEGLVPKNKGDWPELKPIEPR